MIRLQRVRTKQAIPAVFRGAKRIEKALTLLVEADAKREFDSGYWKKAKKQLKIESSGKCAYCEAPTAVVAHGDVEHFRPKGVYWWLAYCYDNYLFSCQICNQTFKGDNFPLGDETLRLTAPVLPASVTEAQKRELARRFAPDPLDAADGQPWAEFEAVCKAEGCHLLNPYVDDPEEHFVWEADPTLQEVAVQPKNSALQRFHQAAEQFYGLNRPELLVERWKSFQKLDVFRKAFASPDIDDALRGEIGTMLRLMMRDDAPFAGMCRYFVRQVWQLLL
jgi:hypothetical protein